MSDRREPTAQIGSWCNYLRTTAQERLPRPRTPFPLPSASRESQHPRMLCLHVHTIGIDAGESKGGFRLTAAAASAAAALAASSLVMS